MDNFIGLLIIIAVVTFWVLFFRYKINNISDVEPEISVMVDQTEPVTMSLTEQAVYEYHQHLRETGQEII